MAVNFRTEQITENHQVILKLVELLPKVGGILIIVFRFTGDLKKHKQNTITPTCNSRSVKIQIIVGQVSSSGP